MKPLRYLAAAIIAFALFFSPAFAKSSGSHSSSHSSGGEVHVKGYTKKDGTYVAPHMRTAPNGTKNDNWSTQGNVNPYTGKAGTKPRDDEYTSAPSAVQTPAYSAPAAGTSIPTPTPAPAPIVSQPRKFAPGSVQPGMTRSEVLHSMGVPWEKSGNGWIYAGRTVKFSSNGLTQ